MNIKEFYDAVKAKAEETLPITDDVWQAHFTATLIGEYWQEGDDNVNDAADAVVRIQNRSTDHYAHI